MKRCDVQREESLTTVKKEISILENFAGPYLVKLLGADIINSKTNHRQALILLEFCPGGHLLDRLLARDGSYLPIDIIYKVFGQLLTVVHTLHCNNPIVVHRDLKLENILFGDDGCVRLCDFVSCEMGIVPLTNSEQRATTEEKLSKETTQMYRAPEMIDLYLRNELTEKTDIWVCIGYIVIESGLIYYEVLQCIYALYGYIYDYIYTYISLYIGIGLYILCYMLFDTSIPRLWSTWYSQW